MTRSAVGFTVVNELDNEKRVRILGIIDKIRELGVSEDVSLPQLVVVGDQSSGKSSVLEGLTGLSFPIASDLCTRFATQIVLRRAPTSEAIVRITIIPGPGAQADEVVKERLSRFERQLIPDEFDISELQKIFDEAAECMGVPGPSTANLEDVEKRFSDDILKIELSGPEHHHLSVVDVPGLFHNPTKYQTEEDRAIIRKLIEDYITDKRTIILAVMDARNNLANQEVFSMARAADPAGKRTVGIITKCDALQVGDEQGVLRIAQNQVERLNHGWFVVKNRSTQEIMEGVTIEDRHKREKRFFAATAPWNELKKNRVGIHALKTFLGTLLYNHISIEFPAVVKDIEKLSLETQKELELLGPSRQTSGDQRRFLAGLARAYEKHVMLALSGSYEAELEPDSPLKLRMQVRRLNDEFADDMTRKGHATPFFNVEGTVDEAYARSSGDRESIIDWIRTTYRDARGTELPGVVSPAVIENLFRQQSGPWESISKTYLERAIAAAKKFNEVILERMLSDEDVRAKVTSRLVESESKVLTCAFDQLAITLKDERAGILQTVNHYYADTLSAIREARVLARLKATGIDDGYAFDTDRVMKSVHLSNEDQTIIDIHDILKAYYKVALKRYMDNIVIQIVERVILGTGGPMQTFSTDMVDDLQDEELAYIAGETFAISSSRNDLIAKYERFQKALAIAKQAGV